MRHLYWLYALFFLVLAPAVVIAESDLDNCYPVIPKILQTLHNFCPFQNPTDRESIGDKACYGNNQVKATVQPGVTKPFDKPGDKLDIDDFQSIQSEIDQQNDIWGVATLKYQTRDTSRPDVVIFAVGNTRIERKDGGNLELKGDDFFLWNDAQPDTCAMLPSFLVIDNTSGVEITVTVNNTPIKTRSVALVRVLPGVVGKSVMQVINIEGKISLLQPNSTEFDLGVNYATERCLVDSPANLGLNGKNDDYIVDANCSWSLPRPLLSHEVILAVIVPLLINPIPPAANQCPNGGANFVYTVGYGDTLGLIAQTYGVTVEQLIADNNIANPNIIQPGQTLTIKCATQPTSTVPSTPPSSGPSALPPCGDIAFAGAAGSANASASASGGSTSVTGSTAGGGAAVAGASSIPCP